MYYILFLLSVLLQKIYSLKRGMYCFYVLYTVSIKPTVAKNLLLETLNVLFLCTMYCFY